MWGTGKDIAALSVGLGSSTCYKVKLTSPGWDPDGTQVGPLPITRGVQTAVSEKTHTTIKLKIEPHKGGLVKKRKTKA